MSAPPARHSVAPRSARSLPTASRPCCLRCSKHQGADPGLTCVKVGTRRVCERCRRLNKPCHDVPQSFIAPLNRLLARSDAVAGLRGSDAFPAAAAALVRRQRTFTSRVEAAVRAARAPQTPAAMAQAVLSSLALMQATLNGIADVLRYQNNLPPLVAEEDDDEDDDDDDDDDDSEDDEMEVENGSPTL